MFLGLNELFKFEEFFLIFPCKNHVSFVCDFLCLKSLDLEWAERLTPSESLRRGKISGWFPIPFFDSVGDIWVTGPSPSHQFKRLPEAYQPTKARKPHEWLRMDMDEIEWRSFLLGLQGPSEGAAGIDDRPCCDVLRSFAVVWRGFHLGMLVGDIAIFWGFRRHGRWSRLCFLYARAKQTECYKKALSISSG